MSLRALHTEEDLIDDVVESFCHEKGMTSLAVGCPYWTPPKEAIEETFKLKDDPTIHRYSSVSGTNELKQEIAHRLHSLHLDISDLSIIVTNGANQGFFATILAISDPGDDVVLLCPHYAYHKAALQLASVNVHLAPFDAHFRPQWRVLETVITAVKPKAVVVTNPCNPSGTVLSMEETQDLVNMAKSCGAYIIMDQVYHSFVYTDNDRGTPATSITSEKHHVIPCSVVFHYDRIIHLFSCSKEFGMCGWRVGYLTCPSHLEAQYKKAHLRIACVCYVCRFKTLILCTLLSLVSTLRCSVFCLIAAYASAVEKDSLARFSKNFRVSEISFGVKSNRLVAKSLKGLSIFSYHFRMRYDFAPLAN